MEVAGGRSGWMFIVTTNQGWNGGPTEFFLPFYFPFILFFYNSQASTSRLSP